MKSGQNLRHMKSFFNDNRVTESWKDKFQQKNNDKKARNLKRTKHKRK